MDRLPCELFSYFFDSLSLSDNCALACTHQAAHIQFQKKTRPDRLAGCYLLRPHQADIRNTLAQTKDGNYLIQAPVSYGKTAIALSLIFGDWEGGKPRTGPLYVAIVPPKAFLTWINEATKMYGASIFAAKSADSPIVACLGITSKVHNQLYSTTGELSNILHPNTRLVLLSNKTCLRRWELFAGSRVIVDEAHTCHQWREFVERPQYSWILLMSASEITTPLAITKTFHLKDKINEGRVPSTITYMYIVKGEGEETYKPVPIKSRTLDIELYAHAAASSVASLSNAARIVMFLPGGEIFRLLLPYINAYMATLNRTVFVFVRGLSIIHRFENCPNPCVLLLSHELSESININAEAAVCVRGDWVNVERFGQMLSRVLRITNPNKCVQIIQVVPEGYPQYKVNYADCCRQLGIHTSGEQIQDGELLMSYRIIRAYGKDINSVTAADIVAICDQNHSPENKTRLLEWWRTQQSSFTPEQQNTLLH